MEQELRATVRRVASKPGFVTSFHITIPPGGTTERVLHKFPFVVRYRRAARIERTVWKNGEARTMVEDVQAFYPYYREAGTDQQARNLDSEALDFDKDEIECPPPEEGDDEPVVPQGPSSESAG